MLAKEVQLLSEAAKKKPKLIKPKKMPKRPKKTLWYAHSSLWRNDVQNTFPNYQYFQEENEEAIYAMDPHQSKCYGAWYPKKKMGVAFHIPRPKHVVIHPRARIQKFTPQ